MLSAGAFLAGKRGEILAGFRALLVAGVLAGPAQGADCGWIDAFVAQAAPPDAAACEGEVCLWSHGYRDPAARARFDALSAALEACLGHAISQDAPVNHPDSYVLRQFGQGAGTVYLSIKDKAALQRTLVFLRTGP